MALTEEEVFVTKVTAYLKEDGYAPIEVWIEIYKTAQGHFRPSWSHRVGTYCDVNPGPSEDEVIAKWRSSMNSARLIEVSKR
ncbi:MAG: hypothetical protein EOP04_09985 [Proteobacteria bacterium]|nr:MAG: hypothetical protein EOP04_09985 [Pseudomonadota bacterium]